VQLADGRVDAVGDDTLRRPVDEHVQARRGTLLPDLSTPTSTCCPAVFPWLVVSE